MVEMVAQYYEYPSTVHLKMVKDDKFHIMGILPQ